MIKVEHTKTHLILAMGIHPEKRVLVTEAKLVLVPNYHLIIDPDKMYLFGKDSQFKLSNDCVEILKSGFINYQPILISKTEKIEVGDWVYDFMHQPYQAIRDIPLNDGVFKILALPEHFSPEQLQMIVDCKLKDGSIVLLGCEELAVRYRSEYKLEKFIKLNPHITIYPVEEKMYTREEVKTIVKSVVEELDRDLNERRLAKQSWTEKWFEQNVK